MTRTSPLLPYAALLAAVLCSSCGDPPATADARADVDASSMTDTTDADALGADAPDADAPGADGPDADVPNADAPDADVPDADASDPDADVPDADVTDADAADADVQDADASDADVPPMTDGPGDADVPPPDAGPPRMTFTFVSAALVGGTAGGPQMRATITWHGMLRGENDAGVRLEAFFR